MITISSFAARIDCFQQLLFRIHFFQHFKFCREFTCIYDCYSIHTCTCQIRVGKKRIFFKSTVGCSVKYSDPLTRLLHLKTGEIQYCNAVDASRNIGTRFISRETPLALSLALEKYIGTQSAKVIIVSCDEYKWIRDSIALYHPTYILASNF